MAKKVVTLYIDDTGVRLLVTQGKRIKKWADLPLEPGLVKNAVVIEEAEAAARIKQFLKDQKVKTKKVVVGISGLHCLTRPLTLPQLPRAMLAEAVKREAERVLPVPLEQLYISWQSLPSTEGKIKVFLVAVPCQAADALLRMLSLVGLKTDLMDLKPLVLARVVKRKTAIIVDVQPSEFDIVIMVDGVPQPIRTVSLPSEALSWQEKLPRIRDELDRTIKFYNSNNPEKPLDSSTSIFASGELADKPKLCQSLSKELGYPVVVLPSPLLKCPKGLDSNHYLVNIGLALEKRSSGSEAGTLVTDLNALPAPYRPKPLSLTRVFALPVAAIAIGLLVPVVILIQGASANIDSLRGGLDMTGQLLQRRISERQELMNNIKELEKEIAEGEESRGAFTAMIGNVEKQSNGLNGDLKVTMSSLPSAISLTNIRHADGTLTIRGRSPGEQEVLSYLRSLDDSGRFSEIVISSIRRIEGEESEGEEIESEGMDFTLIFEVGERD